MSKDNPADQERAGPTWEAIAKRLAASAPPGSLPPLASTELPDAGQSPNVASPQPGAGLPKRTDAANPVRRRSAANRASTAAIWATPARDLAGPPTWESIDARLLDQPKTTLPKVSEPGVLPQEPAALTPATSRHLSWPPASTEPPRRAEPLETPATKPTEEPAPPGAGLPSWPPASTEQSPKTAPPSLPSFKPAVEPDQPAAITPSQAGSPTWDAIDARLLDQPKSPPPKVSAPGIPPTEPAVQAPPTAGLPSWPPARADQPRRTEPLETPAAKPTKDPAPPGAGLPSWPPASTDQPPKAAPSIPPSFKPAIEPDQPVAFTPSTTSPTWNSINARRLDQPKTTPPKVSDPGVSLTEPVVATSPRSGLPSLVDANDSPAVKVEPPDAVVNDPAQDLAQPATVHTPAQNLPSWPPASAGRPAPAEPMDPPFGDLDEDPAPPDSGPPTWDSIGPAQDNAMPVWDPATEESTGEDTGEATDPSGTAPARPTQPVAPQPPVTLPGPYAGPALAGSGDTASDEAASHGNLVPNWRTATNTPSSGPQRATPSAGRPAPDDQGETDTGENPLVPSRHVTARLPVKGKGMRRRHRRWIVPLLLVLLLAGAYLLASWWFSDKVPVQTTAGGVDISGLTRSEAIAKLDSTLGAHTTEPVNVNVGDQLAQFDPVVAGLSFDAAATVDQVVGLSFWPLDVWHHFRGETTIGLAIGLDAKSLDSAIATLAGQTATQPVDATLTVTSGSPETTSPVDGVELDQAATATFIKDNWLVTKAPWQLPAKVMPPAIDQAALDEAIAQVAEPLLSAPVAVQVEDATVTITVSDLAAAAELVPQDGKLTLAFKQELLLGAVNRGLPDGLLTLAEDAQFVIEGGRPVIADGTPGKAVDGETLISEVALAALTTGERTATVPLSEVDPAAGRADLEALGVTEQVSYFETLAPANPTRTRNLTKAAEIVSGTLVRPGESFSLDKALGHRSLENGWTSAGVVLNGKMTEGVGGGLSQFSTTLYNAAFLAGMEDVDHTPHSNWFSRYPRGREATLWEGQIDNVFKNNTPYGVVLNAGVTSDNRVWVELWSTKYWQVEEGFGEPHSYTSPRVIEDPSDNCTPQAAGGQGFTISFWRKLTHNGEVAEEKTWTHTYVPVNGYECTKDKPADEATPDD